MTSINWGALRSQIRGGKIVRIGGRSISSLDELQSVRRGIERRAAAQVGRQPSAAAAIAEAAGAAVTNGETSDPTELVELRQNCADLQGQVDQLTAKNVDLTGQLATAEAKSADLQGQVDEMATKLRAYEASQQPGGPGEGESAPATEASDTADKKTTGKRSGADS